MGCPLQGSVGRRIWQKSGTAFPTLYDGYRRQGWIVCYKFLGINIQATKLIFFLPCTGFCYPPTPDQLSTTPQPHMQPSCSQVTSTSTVSIRSVIFVASLYPSICVCRCEPCLAIGTRGACSHTSYRRIGGVIAHR